MQVHHLANNDNTIRSLRGRMKIALTTEAPLNSRYATDPDVATIDTTVGTTHKKPTLLAPLVTSTHTPL